MRRPCEFSAQALRRPAALLSVGLLAALLLTGCPRRKPAADSSTPPPVEPAATASPLPEGSGEGTGITTAPQGAAVATPGRADGQVALDADEATTAAAKAAPTAAAAQPQGTTTAPTASATAPTGAPTTTAKKQTATTANPKQAVEDPKNYVEVTLPKRR